MYKGLRVGAVIVAAGKSRRMGTNINKQFANICGVPVLARTLLTFDNIDFIDNMILIVGQDYMDYVKENLLEKFDIKKPVIIKAGGEERQESMMNGLEAVRGVCDIVVTHDGARPLVTADIINRSIEAAYTYGAAACAVPVKDTIKVIGSDGFIMDNPERSKLYAVQTPQTFKFDLLYKAHNQALKDGFVGTDDTVLVQRAGSKVRLFEGSYENIKITTPEDIYMAEAILNYRKNR